MSKQMSEGVALPLHIFRQPIVLRLLTALPGRQKSEALASL